MFVVTTLNYFFTFFTAVIVENFHIGYPIIFSIIIISYFLCKPAVKLFIRMNSIMLITYFMSSFILLFLLIGISRGFQLDSLLMEYFETALHCLIIFGGFLLIRRLYVHVFRR